MGRQILAVALLAALATPVGAARADNTDKILADCADGVIDGSYSRSDLKKASNRIPSDIDEYSDCRGALAQARLDAGSGSGGTTNGGSGGTGGSGSTGTPAGDPNLVTPANPTGVTQASADPQNPTETTAINEATRKGGSPVSFGPGARISPGSTGLASDDRRSIPNPLLVALILLTTAALLGAVLAARARVITRRLS